MYDNRKEYFLKIEALLVACVDLYAGSFEQFETKEKLLNFAISSAILKDHTNLESLSTAELFSVVMMLRSFLEDIDTVEYYSKE